MPKKANRSNATAAPEAAPANVTQRRKQMADVARLAGVATSTVSRALSGSPLVNEETRTRILELAASLNYTINVGARNLRQGSNRTIAVVVSDDEERRQDLSDPFFLSLLGMLADALTERGFNMLVARVGSQHLATAVSYYETGLALGVILIGHWRHHDQLNQLAARRVPLVVWGAQLDQQLYCTVGSDNINGGDQAVSHLIGLGRRRIVFLGDIRYPEMAQRCAGYRAALARAGIDFDPRLQIATSFNAEDCKRVVQRMVDDGIAFDAMFVVSDLLAMTAINTLRELGRSIPDEVSVVGFDDIALASYFHPALTTVRQSLEDVASAMVDAMLAQIDGQPAPPRQLPTRLVVRGSSASSRSGTTASPVSARR
jgi:DNA-binding LacI/PurR family transcriptional regulator